MSVNLNFRVKHSDKRRRKHRKKPPLTLTWEDLPAWQRDNEYILSGYRPVQNHWRGCFTSIFAYLHNETVNIHSHLWGAVLFIYLLLDFNSKYRTGMTWTDVAVFTAFLCCAVFCLAASALYHTVTCHSEKVSSSCHALDYAGIVVLTVGSFYPSVYYAFHCRVFLQIFYILSITVIGSGVAYIVLHPEYAKPTHRGTRTKMFVALGLCAVVPMCHILNTWNDSPFSEIGLWLACGFRWSVYYRRIVVVCCISYLVAIISALILN